MARIKFDRITVNAVFRFLRGCAENKDCGREMLLDAIKESVEGLKSSLDKKYEVCTAFNGLESQSRHDSDEAV